SPAVHAIDFGADRVAEMQVFREESTAPTQPTDVAQVESTEIERNKKHFMRIDHGGIGFGPPSGDPFALRQKRESSAVCTIDMEPHFVFAAHLRNLGNWIDTGC